MSNQLAAVKENAVSLRNFLYKDTVKSQLGLAIPKWLSVDRLLRVVFSSAMRTPKLLECSQESILQSVMMCAQLGLEPILGRAYLIPYNNRKNINGRWTSVVECQMQIGYQGLIDLARRSDSISDVWGANVYENDFFELDYGMERGLRHKPWFMDPEKRKANNPGDIIGAYVVWQLKDGTKHPDFMPISEIHKRRNTSQAYTWAETGDPAKGGGKQDSVWHKWPEEMNLKTVIKHSAKMVPSSIEFMTAVQMDSDVEVGKKMVYHDNIETPLIVDGETQHDETDELAAEFNAIAQKHVKFVEDLIDFDKFVEATAKANDKPIIDFKADVIRANDFDNFLSAFNRHLEKLSAEKPKSAPPEKPKEITSTTEQPATSVSGDGHQSKKTDDWDPRTAPLMDRYVAEKTEIVKSCANEMGIQADGRRTKYIHADIIALIAQQPPDDIPGDGQEQAQGTVSETSEADQGNDKGDDENAAPAGLDAIMKSREWIEFGQMQKRFPHAYAHVRDKNDNFRYPKSIEQIAGWINKIQEFADFSGDGDGGKW